MIKSYKSLPIILMLLSILNSCGKESKNENSVNKKTTSKVNVVKNTVETINNATSLMETTPLSIDELKTWLPDNLQTLNKIEAKDAPLSANDISGVVADFEGADKQKIQLTLYDCAGKNGGLVLGKYMLYKNMTINSENDYKIEQSFNKNGMIGIEIFEKNRKYSNISFLFKDRLGFNVLAYEMDRESVWKAIEELNINKLLKND